MTVGVVIVTSQNELQASSRIRDPVTMTHRSDRLTVRRTSAPRPPLEGSVSTTYLDGLLQFAVACGAARDVLLQEIGLTEHVIANPDGRLPLEAARQLFDRAANMVGDPAFALHFGTGVPCATLTLASTLAAALPAPTSTPASPVRANDGTGRTLRDALDGLNRYASLGVDFGAHTPAQRFRFVHDTAGVWLEDLRPDHADGFAWPALSESVFARFATGIRRRGGEHIVRALHVTHRAPRHKGHRDAYDTVFRVSVTFGAARNAICLDPAFLDQPLEPLPAPVQAVLTPHAEAQLRAIRLPGAHATSWRERVEAHLRALLPSDAQPQAVVTIATVCRAMAVSRHTLHRRLREEGTTFAALYDAARHRAADTLLRTSGLPVAVVASRLGYSEPAAFSRAYLRWTGVRPSAAARRASAPHHGLLEPPTTAARAAR